MEPEPAQSTSPLAQSSSSCGGAKSATRAGRTSRSQAEAGTATAWSCSMVAARASTPRALPPIWCQRGRNAASTRGGTGSISRRNAASERRRSRSEEHTSELQSPIDISYAVFCLKKKKKKKKTNNNSNYKKKKKKKKK